MAAINIPLVILAGGRATRLSGETKGRPKFLVPISEELLFADFQLKWAREQGFEHVILCIGHEGEQIRKYCGDGSRFKIDVSYSEDGRELLGTGGALKKAWKSDRK